MRDIVEVMRSNNRRTRGKEKWEGDANALSWVGWVCLCLKFSKASICIKPPRNCNFTMRWIGGRLLLKRCKE